MKLRFDTTLDYFIIFIILIKIVFIVSAIGHVFLSHSGNDELVEKLDPKFTYWKERAEFIFIASMAILLIYHFKPGKNKPISEETALLFFLFGWILLFTAKWQLFFTEAPWFKRLVNSLK